MSEESDKSRIFFIYLLLVLITFIGFEQVRQNDFIDYDDGVCVTENQNVLTGLTAENVKWAFTTDYNSNWHPLTWLSHMLDCQLFGLNPSFHHLSSLLLHIANTLLLFAILNAMTAALWPSAFVAAVFALHPLHVESVAWVAERKDVLSTLFWMLTMAAYLRYVRSPDIGRYLLALLAFALGLMAKPMLVTLPFVLLLLDYWPLNRIEGISLTEPFSRQRIFRLVYEKIPFFILSALSGIITFLAQRAGEAVVPLTALPFRLRLINAILSYVKYLGKIFWPVDLAVFYPINSDELTYGSVLIALAFLLVASFRVIQLAPRHRYLPVGWFWFLGTLLPVIGIVQVGGQAMADRYTYIPSIGIFILAVFGATELLHGLKFRKYEFLITASAIILVLLIQTRMQVRLWQNSISLFEHTLSVTRNNSLIHYNLGRTYQLANNPDKAIENYLEALRLQPQDPDTHNNLGMLLRNQNKLDESIAHFRTAIKIAPGCAAAYSNLGRTLQLQGKFDEAIECLNQSLKLEPDHPVRYYALSAICIKAGRTTEAIESALRACQLTGYSDPYYLDTLAIAYAAAGDFTRAIKTAEKALELAETAGDKNLAQDLQKRLQLYEESRFFPEE